MWWLLGLLITALIAFFAVKAITASTVKKQLQSKLLGQEALDSTAARSETTSSEQPTANAGNVTGAGSEITDTASAAADASGTSGSPGSSGTSGAAGVAGVAAAAGAASIAAAVGGAASANSGGGSSSGLDANTVNTGNAATDIAEMMKILNLAESDASRLDITRDEFEALRQADAAVIADAAKIDNVASRLRKMLA